MMGSAEREPPTWARGGSAASWGGLLERHAELVTLLLAGATRLLVALWAGPRVPPTADGAFYHVVAGRIAEGQGYTWLWPDGVVTFAAHYPVGYPALVGAAYAVFGPSPLVALLQNALLGALGAWAMVGVTRDTVERSRFSEFAGLSAGCVGLCLALSPTLVLYTSAMMTEGAVGSVVALGARAVVSHRRHPRPWLAALVGIIMGAAALLRPQTILLAPFLGAAASAAGGAWRKLLLGTTVCCIALLCCLPWTLRNCDRMERCVFVSANGGWNLLIGTFPEGQGAWVALEGERVPPGCREVFQEAEKDHCFGQAGLERIRAAPLTWLALIPAKLRQTFDSTAAAADHLREAGAVEASYRSIAGLELVYQRLMFAGCAGGAFLRARERGRGRFTAWLLLGVAVAGFAGASAWLGWAAVAILLVCARAPSAGEGLALWSVLTTGAIHAVFFGAGRYALPLIFWSAPLLGVGLSGVFLLTAKLRARDNPAHGPD